MLYRSLLLLCLWVTLTAQASSDEYEPVYIDFQPRLYDVVLVNHNAYYEGHGADIGPAV